jgi:hypothetical protein
MFVYVLPECQGISPYLVELTTRCDIGCQGAWELCLCGCEVCYTNRQTNTTDIPEDEVQSLLGYTAV